MARKRKSDDMFGVGDNSNEHLKSFSERIGNLLDEKDRIGEDLKEIYAEAKRDGVNTKILRKVVAISRKDQAEWQAEQDQIDQMLHAIGVL